MGNGIAQVAARAGYSVILRDVSEDLLQRGMNAIDKSLQRDVDKERLSQEEKQSILNRIQTTTDLNHSNPLRLQSKQLLRTLELRQVLNNWIKSHLQQPFWLRTPHRFRSPSWLRRRDVRKDHWNALHESGAGNEVSGGYSRDCYWTKLTSRCATLPSNLARHRLIATTPPGLFPIVC